MLVLRVRLGVGREDDGTSTGDEGSKRNRAGNDQSTHGAYPAFFLSTASAMLGGIGSGRSILPRIGSRMRKWKK